MHIFGNITACDCCFLIVGTVGQQVTNAADCLFRKTLFLWSASLVLNYTGICAAPFPQSNTMQTVIVNWARGGKKITKLDPVACS